MLITVILGNSPNIPIFPNNTVYFGINTNIYNIPNINGKGNNNGNTRLIVTSMSFGTVFRGIYNLPVYSQCFKEYWFILSSTLVP